MLLSEPLGGADVAAATKSLAASEMFQNVNAMTKFSVIYGM